MASKRRQRRKCERKKRFPNLDLAKEALRRMKMQGVLALGLRIYKCQFCHYYHIGTAQHTPGFLHRHDFKKWHQS